MKNGHSFGESLKCITFFFCNKCIALDLDIMKLLTFELVNKESSVTLGSKVLNCSASLLSLCFLKFLFVSALELFLFFFIFLFKHCN